MEQKAWIYDKECINKNEFHKKRLISIDKVEIRRIVLSKENLYGKKGLFQYFTGYINETDAFPVLCIKHFQPDRMYECMKCINVWVLINVWIL